MAPLFVEKNVENTVNFIKITCSPQMKLTAGDK